MKSFRSRAAPPPAGGWPSAGAPEKSGGPQSRARPSAGASPSAWWDAEDGMPPADVPEFEVDDVAFVQPIGFVWFSRPRYRVKALSRKLPS